MTKYDICRIARESTPRYLSPRLDALEQLPILNSAVGSRGVPSTGAIKTSSFASSRTTAVKLMGSDSTMNELMRAPRLRLSNVTRSYAGKAVGRYQW
jgi:hypothetical protein